MEDVIVSQFESVDQATKAIEELRDLGFTDEELIFWEAPNLDNKLDSLTGDYGFPEEDVQVYRDNLLQVSPILIVKSSVDTEDEIRDVLRENSAHNIKSNVSDRAKEGGPWPTEVSSYQHEISRGGFEDDDQDFEDETE